MLFVVVSACRRRLLAECHGGSLIALAHLADGLSQTLPMPIASGRELGHRAERTAAHESKGDERVGARDDHERQHNGEDRVDEHERLGQVEPLAQCDARLTPAHLLHARHDEQVQHEHAADEEEHADCRTRPPLVAEFVALEGEIDHHEALHT